MNEINQLITRKQTEQDQLGTLLADLKKIGMLQTLKASTSNPRTTRFHFYSQKTFFANFSLRFTI